MIAIHFMTINLSKKGSACFSFAALMRLRLLNSSRCISLTVKELKFISPYFGITSNVFSSRTEKIKQMVLF